MFKKILIITLLLLLTSCGGNNLGNKNSKSINTNIENTINKKDNKKYSYEELLDVFAISGNICKGDILYKKDRYIITKDYSDYELGSFQPSLEEQKKYDELTKNKIYGEENPLDFLAKNDMYCLGILFDGNDLLNHNPLKYKYLEKFYKENEEAKNIVEILEKPEKIDRYKLSKILIFSNKFPRFYEEIKKINKNINISNIFNNLKKKNEKITFFLILDNITRYTDSELIFDEMINFYKKNNLLENKKNYLIKDLEYKNYNLGFLDFNSDKIMKKLLNN